MNKPNVEIAAEFAEIKRNLDPEHDYVIFEFDSQDLERAEIDSLLKRLRPSISNSRSYRDRDGKRSLLLLQLVPNTEEQVIAELAEIRLPARVSSYVYRRAAR